MTPPPRRLLHAAHRAASLPGLRLALFGVLALVACWRPLMLGGALNDFRDSHLLHSYEDAGTRTLTRYGQHPLWNPWACGGQYALGSPQTRVASPTLLVSAALGSRRAEPVVLWAFLVLGMEGFFRYARRRVGSALGALGAAPLFGLTGFTALSWSIGWLNFAGFLLLPWLLLGTRKAAEGKVSGAALVAGVFAFLLGFGGTYPVPMGALFVALEAGRTLFELRGTARRRQALWALGATALFTLAACAYRLWPLLETMRSAPRIMAGTPGQSLVTLGRMMLQLPARSGHSNPGNFFLVPVALALVPVAVVLGRHRARYPAVMAALCVWMAAGYAAKPSLFAGLRLLPIFGTLRYPERFLVPAGLFIAELAALGLAALLVRSWRSRGWGRAAALACVLVVAGWGVQVHAFANLARWASMVAEPPPTPSEAEQPFAQARGNRWAQGHFLALNRGSISCGEAWPVPMSERLRGDLPQEEYLEEADSGTARRVEWTPNRVEVDVAATRPAVLLVNQNWHPGWKASVGEVVSRDGLLGVRLPEGEHRVVLRFVPRSGVGGAIVSLLAWAGLAFLVWRPRVRGGRLGPEALMVASVPLLAWAALLTLWREPVARAVPRNPDGSLMVTASLPPVARRLDVRFDAPVELVAAEVPGAPDAEGLVHLVLYWRVTGPVPRSAGVFVHLPGPEGSKRKNADHAVLGGTFFLREAPRDVLLRDAFAVSTKDWEAGEWKVLVGLWHASGDGSRLGARGADGRPLHESRVEAGTFTVPAKPSP
ncbi:YfhO family protein [Pyxidicoccus trucidator]|uniref:YfhO family protein n=1 Tax=Pyxidicoccus trucidator TaxID=2709662 RepID=UPI0013DD6813|nr:YfhO family protein [Pyxidicoccus trucidator]